MARPRAKISAFVVACNEEDQIARCLESLQFCDEILVVDSFSTDRTVEIARKHGARVIQHPWQGYVGQKAYALTETTFEWVLNIDADERVSDQLRESIEQILIASDSSDQGIVGYEVNRVVFHLGRWWRRGGWYPEYRTRFFKKQHVEWGGVEPHERAIVHGKTARLAGELEHYSFDSLDDQFGRLHHLSSVAARAEFARGRRASMTAILLNPILRALKFYLLKGGFREGFAGVIVAIAEGYYTYMKYAKLWALARESSPDVAQTSGQKVREEGNG